MNRTQKETVVADIRKHLSSAQGSFLVKYRGLSVAQLEGLRKLLRQKRGSMQITKWRLMRLAAQDVPGIDDFRSQLGDQVGLIFADEEVPAIAKAIVEFAKENDALEVISAFFEERVLSKEQVMALASLPSREVLLAMLAGTLQAPIGGLARGLNGLLQKLVYALAEIEKQKKAQGA